MAKAGMRVRVGVRVGFRARAEVRVRSGVRARVKLYVSASRACRLTRASMISSRLLVAAAMPSCARSAFIDASRSAARCACAALADRAFSATWPLMPRLMRMISLAGERTWLGLGSGSGSGLGLGSGSGSGSGSGLASLLGRLLAPLLGRAEPCEGALLLDLEALLAPLLDGGRLGQCLLGARVG
eukprot:scaffold59676_cov37-Phaeocystis_antarctica.AAC.1